MVGSLIALLSLPAFANDAEPACEQELTDQDIRAIVRTAEEDFLNLDAEGFKKGRDRLLDGMECASELLSSPSVAGYFRVRALDAFLRRSNTEVKANAWAMSQVDPSPPVSSVIPRGHPVRNAWELGRQRGPSTTILLSVPDGGRVIIDGRDVLEMPVERPRVVQRLDSDGRVIWTRLFDSDELPEYRALPESESARNKYTNAVVIAAPRKPVELPVIAGVLAAGAIGTYAASYASFKKFGNENEDAKVRSLRSTTNALYFTSAGLAVGAVGIGTYAAFRW